MAQCNLEELLANGECFACLEPGQLQVIIAQLLCEIVAAGGGGGTGSNCNSGGTGSPEGVVTATPGCMYIQQDNDNVWIKKTGSGNTGWLLIIA